MKRRAFLLLGASAPIVALARLIPAPSPSSRSLDALAYFRWSEEAARAYAAQQLEHRAQLAAITGGKEVQLFIAQRQAESIRLLDSIRSDLSIFVSSSGGPSEPPSFARIGECKRALFFRSTLASY